MVKNALDFDGLSYYTEKTKDYIEQIADTKVDSVKIGETEYKSGTTVTLPVYTKDDIDTTFGADISLDIDTSTYKMTLALKDNKGNELTSKEIDFPIESMVVNASYTDGTLTLTLQNGNTLDVDISNIISGLVPDTRKIAGIDLKDDITATELKTALDIASDITTFTNIKVGDTTITADNASDTLELVAGSNVTITPDATNDKITISSTNTTYDLATTTADGLMSKEDKVKIENLSAGSVIGVKGNAETTYRTGNVNITKANIGLGNVDNTADKDKSVKYAESAGSATKATQDGNGNNIVNTYVNKSKILDTAELISANTASGNVAGALAVKEIRDALNTSISTLNTNLQTAVWGNGNADNFERMKGLVENKKIPTDKPFMMKEISYGHSTLIGHCYNNYTYGGFLVITIGEVYYAKVYNGTLASLTKIGDYAESANRATNDSNGRNISTGYMKHYDGYVSKFNDMLTRGKYLVNGAYKKTEGSPVDGNLYGVLYVFLCDDTRTHNNSSTWLFHVLLDTYGNIRVRRNINADGWSSWRSLCKDDYTPTGGGIEFQIVNGKLQYRYDTSVWG